MCVYVFACIGSFKIVNLLFLISFLFFSLVNLFSCRCSCRVLYFLCSRVVLLSNIRCQHRQRNLVCELLQI